MESQPLPSKAALSTVAPRQAQRLRKITILALENETSVAQIVTNPQRRPIDAQQAELTATPTMNGIARALAAVHPKDLGRAKVILLGVRMDVSIGVGIMTLRSRHKKLWLRRDHRKLPIADLRDITTAVEACEANDETICPALAGAIADSTIAVILVDHPVLTEVWIALIKPKEFLSLNTDPHFWVARDHKQYQHDQLFPEPGVLAWLRRATHTVLSALPKVLATIGGLTLLGHKLGLLEFL